ncbi:MAG: adenosine kinase [Treponema sp.]|jgi:sugar/nucleoside kinase (ribokinase family)|nr:adenosine kinase [Treponema sp.]
MDLELLCIGNALVDIFAIGEEDIDFRYGLTEPVQHVPMEKLREILSVLPEFQVVSGGGAANVAKIAGMLGVKAGFIGALGTGPGKKRDKTDQFGCVFENELAEAGVQTWLPRKPSPTGVCLMLQMNDGASRIAASPSAALELSEEDIDEDALRQARVVVIDGYMLDRGKLVKHIFDLADSCGTIVALDVSSTGLARERALEIITYARAYPLILFMNEDEARAFYQVISQSGEDPLKESPGRTDVLGPQMIGLFRGFTANDFFPILTVKLGNRGAVVFAGGNVYRKETIPVIPLETTGAGDTFCAAFLAAWIRDKPLDECADLGNKAARQVLDVQGAQPDPKGLKSLERYLKK